MPVPVSSISQAIPYCWKLTQIKLINPVMHSQLLPTTAFHPDRRVVKLDLGINGGEQSSNFIASQLDEFFNQNAAYKCIISGFLPTPIVLVVDVVGKMDCESGRCRRTDGRKWRCSRNVVPNQKYCERHMHRGRQGSRKHVEHLGNVARADIQMPGEIGIPMIALVTPGVNNRTHVLDKGMVEPSRLHQSCSNGGSGLEKTKKSGIQKGGNCATGKNFVDNVKDNRRKRGVKNSNFGFVLSSFGLSPTSVLHCSGVACKVGISSPSQSVAEAEGRRRCRRTDGKKWQCRHDAVPNQKYCEAHMHRGAKRAVWNPYCPSGSVRGGTESTGARNRDSSINLNTIPASPQCIYCNSSTSTSSDATTITDENIASFHRLC